MTSTTSPTTAGRMPLTAAERDALATELQQLRSTDNAVADASDPTDPTGVVNDRIVLLEDALARAEVIPADGDGYPVAAVGTAVEIDNGGRRRTYQLVLGVAPGHGDAVSATSPVGAALLGQPVGATVDVHLPGGRTRSLELLRIAAADTA
jgi:transcription elongation factor GreA